MNMITPALGFFAPVFPGPHTNPVALTEEVALLRPLRFDVCVREREKVLLYANKNRHLFLRIQRRKEFGKEVVEGRNDRRKDLETLLVDHPDCPVSQ